VRVANRCRLICAVCTLFVACARGAVSTIEDGGGSRASVEAGPPDASVDFPTGPVRFTWTNVAPDGNGAASVNVAWAAWADGDGPWQPLTGTDGRYTFDVTQGRFGLAYVCGARQFTSEWLGGRVINATVLEMTELRTHCLPPIARPYTVAKLHIKVLGVPPYETVHVFLASPSSDPIEAQGDGNYLSYDYTAEVLPDSYDFTAVQVGDEPRALVRRGVAVAGGDMTVELDMAAQGVPLVKNVLSIEESPSYSGGAIGGGVDLITSRNVHLELGTAGMPSGSRQVWAVAPRGLATDDIQQLHLGTYGGGFREIGRSLLHAFRQPGGMKVTMPRALKPEQTTITTATKEPFRPRVTFERYAGATHYELAAGNNLGWTAVVTPRWLDQQTTYELPDLTAVSGFKDEWGISTFGTISVTFAAITSNRDLARSIGDDRARDDGADLKTAWYTESPYTP
jgi:hypothetical protein